MRQSASPPDPEALALAKHGLAHVLALTKKFSEADEPRVRVTLLDAVTLMASAASAGEARVAYRLPDSARLEVSVFDVTGRLVRILETGRSAGGVRSPAWDGRDDGGRLLSPGVYFLRLAADSGLHATERVVLLR